MTLIALLLSIFDFFLHNLFPIANVLPSVIKIDERIIKCASYNFLGSFLFLLLYYYLSILDVMIVLV